MKLSSAIPKNFYPARMAFEILQSEMYRLAVEAVIVDEAHYVLKW